MAAWRADPERAAELSRRANLVASMTAAGTPYDAAEKDVLASAVQLPKFRQKPLVSPMRVAKYPAVSMAGMCAADLRKKAAAWRGGKRAALHWVDTLVHQRDGLRALLQVPRIQGQLRGCLEALHDETQRIIDAALALEADACRHLENLGLSKPVPLGSTEASILRRAVEALSLWERERQSKGRSGKKRSTISGKKRSTIKGEAQAKIIAALTQHHQYQKGSCLKLEPIGVNELARRADVAEFSVSDFFKKNFEGHLKYKVVCRDPSRLAESLKVLNKEFSPMMLYGRNPPGEGNRDEDE